MTTEETKYKIPSTDEVIHVIVQEAIDAIIAKLKKQEKNVYCNSAWANFPYFDRAATELEKMGYKVSRSKENIYVSLPI